MICSQAGNHSENDLETYRPDTETFQNEAKKIIEEIRKLNTDSRFFGFVYAILLKM